MTLTAIDIHAALIVIDLQKGIMTRPTTDVVQRAAAVARGFRNHNLPVVLVKVTGGASGRTDATRETSTAQTPPPGWADLADELDPQPEDHLVTKNTWGAFQDTSRDGQVETLGVTQLVLAGVATSIGSRVHCPLGPRTRLPRRPGDRRHDRHGRRRPPQQHHTNFSSAGRDRHHRRSPHHARQPLSIPGTTKEVATMDITISADVPAEQGGEATRKGSPSRQWLMSHEAEDGLTFRIFRSQYHGGDQAFETPRHHHPFQQIRWAEQSSMNFGPDHDIAQGDIAYFPRGAYYGPQRRDHGIGVTVQFGFGPEMAGGKDALRVHHDGIKNLRQRGSIEDGIFIDTDPDTGAERRRAATDVIAQEHTGTSFTTPPEGSAAPILMHRQASTCYQTSPGVNVKTLGAFYDHPGPHGDVRMSLVQLSHAGQYELAVDRAHLLWTTSPGLQIEDQTYPTMTCVYSPVGEEATLSTHQSTSAYVDTFPRLDGVAM